MNEYTILLTWDDESQRWGVSNDDIPLTLESGSLDVLMERCRYIAPEMLALNGKSKDDVYLKFVAERCAKAFA
ncbi:MAG: DUF1902 domain-containing protein [Treponema sp.]|jgi:hypothetical protein|nr:DUF1902 domain-containing protein [Treponema sp.]